MLAFALKEQILILKVFEYQTVYNGYTALLAGLVSSVHCVAMCGPLSCAFGAQANQCGSSSALLVSYHSAKLFAYTVIGGLVGAFGGVILDFLQLSWLGFVPWVLVLFFLIVAFRLDRFLPKPVWLAKLSRRYLAHIAGVNGILRAAFIGLASPLLPCGPLYIIFGLCLFSGSAARGSEFALGFGLGTLPLLWLAQSQFMRLNIKIDSKMSARLRRLVAFLAALVIVWRLRDRLGLEGAVEWLCR